MSEITKKLVDISEVMTDGTMFIKMRSLMEAMEQKVNEGDEAAEQLVDFVNKFHKLCLYAQKSS